VIQGFASFDNLTFGPSIFQYTPQFVAHTGGSSDRHTSRKKNRAGMDAEGRRGGGGSSLMKKKKDGVTKEEEENEEEEMPSQKRWDT
jgi:hypothetical protein